MSETTTVTRSLVSAPLPQIIERLGLSIAQAQAALDNNSVKVAQAMAETPVELGGQTYNLLTLGFTPSFYAFTEATVEAKLSFSMSETTETSVSAGVTAKVNYGVVMVAASVDVSYARKFSVSAEGSSSIAARLVSLPAPEAFNEVLRRLYDDGLPGADN
ncbi:MULTISPECIES: hypothetical protein [Pseudomonadaceae]|jgi:hypothetical protein|uniref:Uncharacterized protein n=3 Tax=Pseudomonadaceae TaxID=135621 RepID=A0A1S8DJU8_9GAMM|nr:MULTISPECIES: hypothetical protein [Pseudomonadaceae]MAC98381.1 hypothetical protein [Pseudomonadales bacterium]MED5491951.1 hypothetical protein [Pseudomonadota bacterium]ONM45614.1 hypothetical protein BXT89_01305 [Halopseudomonas pachastrellae]PBK04102.1 hypothetical protein CNQ84_10690 [Pseudomonas abyssi]RGP53001.1 hypothetical protein ASB58_17305 [Halopseudomonas gallaeciensis]|tara:strand:- start:78308 stop:78787 length:480 start_codon:yes stop_codon:yes gene_type:complete